MPPASSTPRTPPDSEGLLLDGRWLIYPRLNRVLDGETEHQVPDKLMQVLMVLVERRGVVSRRELFDAVWPDTLVVEESLTRAVSGLRKLFDDDPAAPRVIETIPKKGYRLLARVEPISAGGDATPAPPTPARRRGRRLPWPAGLAALTVVVVALLWVRPPFEHRAGSQPTQLRLTALPGVEEYPTLSPAGDRLAFVWDGNRQEPDGVFVQVIGAGAPLRLTDTLGHYAFPAWSHDSRFIAYARLTGPSPGIFMVPATGGAEVELVVDSDGAMLQTPAFSPDGRWLLFARRDPDSGRWLLRRKNLQTGETEGLPPGASGEDGGFRPRFSPDGSRLAVFSGGGDRWRLVVADADGTDARPVPAGDRPVGDFDWTPSGDGLAVSSGGSILLVGLDGSTRRTLATSRSVGTLSLARTGSLLAFSEGRQEKNIWRWTPPEDPATEAVRTRLIRSTGWDAEPALSPDGRSIAFLSDRTGVFQLWLAAADGRDVRRLGDLQHVLGAQPAWAPSGDRIAVTAEVDRVPRTCIVEVPGGRVRVLQPLPGGESQVTWSRDGRWLYVSGSSHGRDEIWRRPSRETAASSAVQITHGGGYRALESPDGRTLYFTRSRRTAEGIWRSDPDGGNPRLAFPLAGGELLAWQVSPRGLVVGYRLQPDSPTFHVARIDPANGEAAELFTLSSRLSLALDVDPVEGSIVYDQTDAVESDIVALEGY